MNLKKESNPSFQKNCFLKKRVWVLIVLFIGIITLCFSILESGDEKSGTDVKRSVCEFKPVRITGDSASPIELAIFVDKLIWTDSRNDNVDIYWYDFITGEETQIASNTAHKEHPAVFAENILCEREPCPQPFLIVWTDERNGNKDIYMYDFNTGKETQITTDPANQEQQAIFNNKIVWSDSRNGNSDIYLYDLFTKEEIQITKDMADQVRPSIYGDKIVWQDYRNGNSDIYLYDLTTKEEIQITTNKEFQFNPIIYQDKIVWKDIRDGNSDIYLYDIITGKEIQITTNSADQERPALYIDKIVWEDLRNGNPDIYLYDLTTKEEIQVTTDTGYQGSPVISGDKIIWLDDRDKGATLFVPLVRYDIYMTTIC